MDECGDFTNGGCEQLCENHPGAFNCTCREGYRVQSDDHAKCRRESNVTSTSTVRYGFPVVDVTRGIVVLCLSSCVRPPLSELRSVCGAQQLRLSCGIPWPWVLRFCTDVLFTVYQRVRKRERMGRIFYLFGFF